MRRAIALIVAAVFAALPARAAEATRLFSDSATIDIRITGPIREIAGKADNSTDPHPATLDLVGAGETHAIELSARGLSRRRPDVCQFPPLRVKFAEKPGETSLFRKQKTLKLVTHCRTTESFQQYTLLEYAAYRMYNVVTDASFKVRLANVEYVDSKSGKTVAKRVGFFIEDVDDLGDRVGLKEVERPYVKVSELDGKAAATAAQFHYMVSNLDWDANSGPEGEDCCHNGRVLGASKDATSGLYLAPYDFDYSGLVDAPYAAPPESIKVKSVRNRVYRGFCAHNAEATAAAALFRERKAAILAALAETPGLTGKTQSKAAKFLASYFEVIEDPKAFESKVLKKCR